MSAAPVRWNFAILTYGELAATQRCLRSLQATMREPFRVFVVDNGSTDGTVEWLASRREPWLHYRQNATNRGVPGGRNDLLAFALPHLRAEDWLVFCDNDLEFGQGWLAPFAAAMRRFPGARLLGKAGHFVEVRDRDRVLAPMATTTGPVDVLSGGFACMARADAAAAIGPFDERLGLFWHEDDDWCVRALQRGFEVVAVPEARIEHHEHATGAANDGLREGGSLQNQAYLADKWRAAGWVDEGGWVRRDRLPQGLGCWQPPAVRAELRRRGGFASPIGRAEFAAAHALLDRLVDAQEPAAAFARSREPVPRCLPVLLHWNRECATAAGADALVRQLDRVDEALRQLAYAPLLRPMVRVAAPRAGAGPAQGICHPGDFDDPDWLAAADALQPSHGQRDPHARDRVFWEQASVLVQLRRHAALERGDRVLMVGERRALVAHWLEERGLQLVDFDPAAPPPAGACAAALIDRVFDQDVVRAALAAAAPTALVVVVGDCVLNGAASRREPQPSQFEHDLLGRAGLAPIAAVRTAVDAALLEGCKDGVASSERRPHLCELLGDRLLTSFAIAARRAPVATPGAAPPSAVLQPRSAAIPDPWAPLAGVTVAVDLRTVAYADSTSRGIGHYTAHHLEAIARRAPRLRLRCHLPTGVELPSRLRLPNVTAADVDDWSPERAELVHLPDPMNLAQGYDSPLRVFRHPRTTVTFHDLTPLRHYVRQWPARTRTAYTDRLRQLERSDAALLCNSRFTADDVVATLGVDPARVTPILAGPNGARPGATADDGLVWREVAARLGLRAPFALHIGALDEHKNFPAALSAFLQVRQRRPLQLVVVGAVDAGIEYWAGHCAARRIPDVVFAGYLPRAELDALYRRAAALLFLSKSEGFGFPLLEAMAGGCPVIASDVTSHPEVTGDAGMLVPLDDAASAAAGALARLLDDRELAASLRARGLERAALFSWERVADRTLEVWSRMLRGAALPTSALGVANASMR